MVTPLCSSRSSCIAAPSNKKTVPCAHRKPNKKEITASNLIGRCSPPHQLSPFGPGILGPFSASTVLFFFFFHLFRMQKACRTMSVRIYMVAPPSPYHGAKTQPKNTTTTKKPFYLEAKLRGRGSLCLISEQPSSWAGEHALLPSATVLPAMNKH